MFKRKIILLAIFLISIAAISAAAAADNATDIAGSQDNGLTDEKLEMMPDAAETGNDSGTFEALEVKITDAEKGSTVTLENDYKNTENVTCPITVDKQLTVDGKGHTIDANGKTAIFDVKAAGVVFKNIIFTNAYSLTDGGAVNGKATAVNCTFMNNHAEGSGGAMSQGDAIGCTFTNNTARLNGGALINGSAVNSIFENNTAGMNGGAMSGSSAEGCIFTGNSAKNGGAALGCVIADSTLTANHASADGGAMWGCEAVNCVIANNTAENGGAMWYGFADSCTFENNDFEGTAIGEPTFSVDNFTTGYNSAEKFLFNLRTSSGRPILNANIDVNVYQDAENIFSFSCLSSGWTVDLPLGSYVFECFAPDFDLGPAYANVTVVRGDSRIRVIANDLYLDDAEGAMFTITLAENVTGYLNVTGDINITEFDVEECERINGTLVFIINNDNFPAGDYNVTVTYSGDENFNGSSAGAVSRIMKFKTSVIPQTLSADLFAGDEFKISYNVTPKEAAGAVRFESSNESVVKVDASTGTVTAVASGRADVFIIFTGNQNYSDANATVAFHVIGAAIEASDVKSPVGTPILYQARLADENGTPISNRTVTFTVDKVSYERITDEKGIAAVELNLNEGTHDIVISTAVSSGVAKNATVFSRISKTKDLDIDYLEAKYTFQALGDDGNPVGAGEMVKMTVNGVTYDIATDKNGYATLPIHLRPNKYTIVSTYKGSTVKNSIKVKYTLKAKKTFKVKKTANKLVLKATLKWSSGKAISGKVYFKFKNKVYSANTKNGVAKVTIKKSVISGLKKGKSYNVKINYKDEILNSKVKVQ